MLFVVLGHSLPFDPPKNPKMKNFEKKKKNAWRYYHFALVYYKWQSWCMVPDISSTADRIFLSFWAVSCPFTPNNPENQHFEKMKKAQGDIIILHKCTINGNHMIYDSWGINCNRHIICHLWPFLALLRYHHFILV